MNTAQNKSRLSLVTISAVAMGSLLATVGATPANAEEPPATSSEQVTLTDAQA